ncbi:MAG TPA: sugar transferase [Kiritimatiellia bacterium]|nr:sugar transferase [Kiritimatiellia bacterium]HRZ11462.1 sugar transferase [Kiritimatiellia bacterium]HSA16987.1 sugar transferase [Kiritimatiellia bacterium]
MLGKSHIRISLRRIVLLALDFLCVAGSIVLAAFLRLGPGDGWDYVLHHRLTLGAACAMFLLVFYSGGMYEREPLLKRKRELAQLPLLTTAIALILIVVLFYARAGASIGRGILLLAGGLIFLGSWGLRTLYRIGMGYGLLSRNALIIGEGNEAREVLRLLAGAPDAGYRVFGIIFGSRTKHEDLVEGIPVLGHISRLNEFADAYAVDTIIVATSLAREHALLRLLRPLRYAGVAIVDYVGLHEELSQEIPLDHIDDEWLMYAAMNNSVIHIRKIKRGMDIVVALIGLALSLPISLLAALAVKLTSRGPMLYRQRRAGQGGQPYTLMKFRTMRQDAEALTGPVWADKFDQRVTPVGRFLRKSRIDEIPQLVNVLRGEMSLVGPRPERPEFVDTLAAAIPFYKERLLVPPGVTGWAQVKYPYAASIEASRRKLQYDLYYIKHMSFVLDILILLRTFKTILAGLRHSEDLEAAATPAAPADPTEGQAKWA